MQMLNVIYLCLNVCSLSVGSGQNLPDTVLSARDMVGHYYLNALFSSVLLLLFSTDGFTDVRKLSGGGWHGYLERGSDLHMAQLMPLPLTISSN